MTLRAGFHGTVAQSSAQVIDGSLKFDSGSNQYLSRTFGSGDRKTYTWSSWVKKTKFGDWYGSLLMRTDELRISNNDKLSFNNSGVDNPESTGVLRDSGSFYHVVFKVDTTQSSGRIKGYINGVEFLSSEAGFSTNDDTDLNDAAVHYIGNGTVSRYADYLLSQVYFIDGLALGPGYFGYTDPLTNTWRPRKFRAEGTTVNDGRVFSSTGSFSNWNTGSYPKTELFDGTVYTGGTPNGASTSGAATAASFDFGDQQITGFQNLQINIFLSSNQASATNIVSVNGVDITQECHAAGNNTWTTVDLGSKFTTLKSFSIANYYIYVGGFIVDGVIMQDSTTTNLAFGTNGFYLPFDGNSPIGQDKSGKGNDWTPVNFGGSNSVDKATGALPILEGAGGAVANIGVRTDANASSLVLALPLVGSANDVSNRINSGSTTKAITVSGSSASTVQSNFYDGSFIFDGSNDYLSTPDSADYDLAGNDWTIEAWVYHSGTNYASYEGIIGQWVDTSGSDRSWIFEAVGSGATSDLEFYYYNTSNSFVGPVQGGTLSKEKWHHVAACRSGNTIRMFIDGVMYGTGTSISANIKNSTNNVTVGGNVAGAGYWNGHIQDVRVYNGVAKYTSNFAPASTNPDILPDTPSGVSGSSKLTKITDGAVSFDGTGDYLSLADSDDIDLTGDISFTVEAFIYKTDSAEDQIFEFRGGGSTGWTLYTTTSNTLQIYDSVANTQVGTSTGKITPNAWNHIALTKNGSGSNNCDFWINGVNSGTFSLASFATTDSTGLRIGASKDTSAFFTGFMSNVRILKGTALYTSEFTPPTAPLTNVTNTKLLCCQSNTSAGAAAVSPNISGINDGRVWSANVSASTGSIVDAGLGFDGSTSTAAYASSSASDTYIYIDFSTALSGTFKLWTGMASGSPTATITHSGGSSSVSLSSGENSLGTFTSVTRIAVNRGEAATHSFQAIAVDDVQLLDPVAVAGDAAATTFNPFNTNTNTVRGQETGYATLNPLQQSLNSTPTISNGNLTLTKSAGSSEWTNTGCTMTIPKSGKWFWEITWTSVGGGSVARCGVADSNDYEFNRNTSGTGLPWLGSGTGTSWSCDVRGYKYNGGTETTGYLSAFAAGDVMGILLDRDNNTITYTRNGVSGGVAHSNVTPDFVTPGFGLHAATTNSLDVNFGQKPFKFPPPDGFQPLNAANLRPDTVISRPDKYVAATTYAGNAGTKTVNVGHKPDFVWVKNRDSNVSHFLYDTVRGFSNGNAYELRSQALNAQGVPGTADTGLTSFDNNGFTLGSDGGANASANYIAWTWKAGGNKNTFNVDDVGYASASDVNMSSGGLNDIVYNDSETWSSAAADSYGFDGSTAYNSSATRLYGASTYHKIVDASTAFTDVTSVIVGTSENVGDIKLDGVVYTTTYTSGEGLTVVKPPSTFSEIEVLGVSGGLQISYVRINGVILVDNGVTPPNAPSIANIGASVGTRQGFSIIKYAGSGSNGTVAHGLSQAPDFFFGRDLEDTGGSRDWIIYHKSIGATGRLKFTTGGTSSSSVFFQNLRPTNKLITVGTSNDINSTNDYILYCWHDVPGLQKFGSYTGNSNANGSYVELGFRPALLWLKRTDAAGNWVILDSKRTPHNPANISAYADTATDANYSPGQPWADMLSNGFKLRATYGEVNVGSYIYAAWAEAPAFNLYGGQSNAR